MKLNQWTIVNLNDIDTYIIGLDKNGKLYKSYNIVNYIDINNKYIRLMTEYDEIELLHNDMYKPTYENKKLFRWDVINTHGDSMLSSQLINLSRYHNEVKLGSNNCYHINDITLDFEQLTDIFKGSVLEGYRDKQVNKRSIFITTQITHIKLHSKYIEVFTESGSNYLLYLSDLYL